MFCLEAFLSVVIVSESRAVGRLRLFCNFYLLPGSDKFGLNDFYYYGHLIKRRLRFLSHQSQEEIALTRIKRIPGWHII